MAVTKQEYAKKIGIIGQRMGAISEEFGAVANRKVESVEDIQAMKSDYEKLVIKFQELEKMFENTETPKGYEPEHLNMLNAFKSYVKATEGMVSSFSVESIESGEHEKYKKAQQTATTELVETTKVTTQKMFGF